MSKQEKYLTEKKYLIPILIFLLNVGVRYFYMNLNGIGASEAFNLFHSQMHVSKIFGNVSSLNNPPFYILFLKCWTLFQRVNEGWIRVPSVFFTSLTPVLIYQMGRKFISFPVGLFSALAYTCCNSTIYFSHEASVYSLITLLSTASMFFYLNILKDPDAPFNSFFLFIINLMLLYSHFYGVIIILTQLIFLIFITRKQEDILTKIIRNNLILLLFFIPGIIIIFKRLAYIKTTGSWLSRPTFDFFYDGFTHESNKSLIAIIFIATILLAFVLFALKRSGENSHIRTAWKLIPFWFFIPYLSIFLFSFWIPIFQARNMVFISPAFYLLLGLALRYAFRKQVLIQYSLMTIFIILMALTIDINPTYKNNIVKVERIIKQMKTPETAVIISPYADFLAFTYYYNKVYFKMCNHTEELANKDHVYYTYNPEKVDEIVNKNYSQILFYQTGLKWEDINEKITRILNKRYAHSEKVYNLKPITVFRFYN
ncbi:MAG: glycosyltransferase family 39 protein [Bacteroidota bacterium]